MSQSQSWQPKNEKRSVAAQVIVLNVLGIDKMGGWEGGTGNSPPSTDMKQTDPSLSRKPRWFPKGQ